MRSRLFGGALVAAAGLLASAGAVGSDPANPDPGGRDVRIHSGGTLAAPSPAAARPVTYGGLLSNGWPVMVETIASGRRINRAVGALESKCLPSGFEPVWQDVWKDVPVSSRGRFSVRFDDSWTEDGVRGEETYTFSGTLNRRAQRVTGKWRSKATYTTIATGQVDTCVTGPLTFAARR